MRDDFGQQDLVTSLLHLRRQRQRGARAANPEKARRWRRRLVIVVVLLLVIGLLGVLAEI